MNDCRHVLNVCKIGFKIALLGALLSLTYAGINILMFIVQKGATLWPTWLGH